MRDLRLSAITLGFPQSVLVPSVAAAFMVGAWVRAPRPGLGGGLALFVAGLASWTLVEYLLHRFMLHRVEPFRSWHLEHHRHPDAPMRIPVAFSLALVLALAALPPLLPLGTGLAAALSCGLIVGHLLQEIVHHRLHGAACRPGSWLGVRQRDHDYHHQRDERAAYGTLTGFWDRVFCTGGG